MIYVGYWLCVFLLIWQQRKIYVSNVELTELREERTKLIVDLAKANECADNAVRQMLNMKKSVRDSRTIFELSILDTSHRKEK